MLWNLASDHQAAPRASQGCLRPRTVTDCQRPVSNSPAVSESRGGGVLPCSEGLIMAGTVPVGRAVYVWEPSSWPVAVHDGWHGSIHVPLPGNGDQ